MMPDSTGYLSEAEQEKIKSWVTDKAHDKYCCSVCKSKEFTLYSHLVSAPITSKKGTNFNTGFEVVGVVCFNCGLVSWFNADTIGVGTDAPYWDPQSDSEKAKDDARQKVDGAS